MLGAIIGDMIGSVYEFKHIRTKDFDVFNKRERMTDDSLLTITIAKTLMNNYPIKYDSESLKKLQNELIGNFVKTWKKNRTAGYGMMFYDWCIRASKGDFTPYNSYGNGAAMRISPVGRVAKSEKEVKVLSRAVTEITHNHPEGIKGAEAVAMAIFLALNGASKKEIKDRMILYYPSIQRFNFDALVKNYKDSDICENTVNVAIYCFLRSNSLEDAIRNAIAIGGDCDTIAAISGSIAEAYFSKNLPSKFEDEFMYLMIDPDVEKIVKDFHTMIGSKKFIRKLLW